MENLLGWATLFRYAKLFISGKSIRNHSMRGHKMQKNANRDKTPLENKYKSKLFG